MSVTAGSTLGSCVVGTRLGAGALAVTLDWLAELQDAHRGRP